MSLRMLLALLALFVGCGVCHGKEGRWSQFAEDGDLKYYLDLKSVVSLPDSVYLFWLKSVAKQKEYFKKEYNLNDLAYIITNYELDCAASSFKIRGTIMFDKNQREINKVLPAADAVFEPVPPESLLELVQGEICAQQEGAAAAPEEAGEQPEAPLAPDAPTAPEAPKVDAPAAIKQPSIM